MDQDMLVIEDNVNFLKGENQDAKRSTHQAPTSTAEPQSILETDASLAILEMQDDSLIATGQHHLWI